MLKRLLGEVWRRVAARSGRSSAARATQSAPELRGEHYAVLLELIHAWLRPATYVEIGVSRGRTLRLACPETEVIGIDPRPRIDQALGPRTRVFAQTSDAFFAERDLRGELGGRAVELAFIDGMHHFEYALRDFMNLEKSCAPGAAILLHDCYPLDEITAARERKTTLWSGDVWRTVLALRKYRPDLSVVTIASPPTGLGLVRGLDPRSRVLEQRFAEIAADLLATDYASIAPRRAELLGLVAGDRESVRALLSSPPA